MEKSAVVALSVYSLSIAFSTKFRWVSVINIFIGFSVGIFYGAIEGDPIIRGDSWPALVIYLLVITSLGERIFRHIWEDEVCQFYAIFDKLKRSVND